MAPTSRAKKSGKEIVLAASITIGAFIGWCCRRKQQEQQQAYLGQLVFNLENCLRKVEIELMRISDLSPSRIRELKAEKNKLLEEIDAVTRAGGLVSPALPDLLDELEREAEDAHEIFYDKRPHLFYYIMVVLCFSFFSFGLISLIIN